MHKPTGKKSRHRAFRSPGRRQDHGDPERAIAIAASAHAGQTDKAGEVYILHPLRVMFRMSTPEERIVAVLHDVVEDSGWTLEGLAAEGFSPAVTHAIGALTKRPGETRADAARRARRNPLARAVKLADNADNMDLSRIRNPTPGDYARLKEYEEVRRILLEEYQPMSTIPEKYRDLLEGPVVVSLATLMQDGTPQVQPVWCGYDGTHLLVNTEKGRQKYRNLSRRKKATILAVDPRDDNRWLEVRGRVVAETEAGAREHIDTLARMYLGVDKYPYHQPGDVRVLFRIEPVRVATMETSMPNFGAGG